MWSFWKKKIYFVFIFFVQLYYAAFKYQAGVAASGKNQTLQYLESKNISSPLFTSSSQFSSPLQSPNSSLSSSISSSLNLHPTKRAFIHCANQQSTELAELMLQHGSDPCQVISPNKCSPAAPLNAHDFLHSPAFFLRLLVVEKTRLSRHFTRSQTKRP